ncbi:MAG: hypothetical protein NW215_01135 [Hyphomicrobiales bacterium]|nr:hypothetical protein [Hyphomicrobiales bacterium]
MTDKPDAVVLIHGVGDQKQRATLSAFLGAVAEPEAKIRQVLHEAPVSSDGPRFTYLTDRRKIDGRDTVVAEMHWSDMSPLRTGTGATILNFFQLIADAPDILYAALAPRNENGQWRDHPALRLWRSIFALAFWVIYYPIIAFNIAYAVLILGYGVTNFNEPKTALVSQALDTILYASAAAIAPLVAIMYVTGSRYVRVLIGMVLLFLAVIAALSYAYENSTGSLTFQQASDALNLVLSVLWLAPVLASAAFLVSLPLMFLMFPKRRQSFLLAFVTSYLIVRFWLLFLSALWLLFLSNVLASEVFREQVQQTADSLERLSLVLLDVAVIAAAFIIAFAHNRLKARARTEMGAEVRYTRLIIPPTTAIAAALLSFVWLASIHYCNCIGACPKAPCSWMTDSTKWILLNVSLVIVVGAALLQVLEGGFDIAGDIVTYFRTDIGHRRPNPVSAVASAFSLRAQQFSTFSHTLTARLKAIVEDLEAYCGPFRQISFITHSLGTMVAIEAIRDLRLQGSTRYNLVTMGSPYKNIFQHYFPHLFAPLASADFPQGLRWLNVYRVNDYVGTEITTEDRFIEERATAERKGHLGYFTDPDAVAAYRPWLQAENAATPA